MLTRRDAIKIGLGLPAAAWAASSKEFWNGKPSSDWTKAEIQDLLNRSPWAKEVNAIPDNGPGNVPGISVPTGNGGGYGGGGLPGLGGGPPMGRPFAPQISSGHFRATVRWDSAFPIREAMHAKPSKDFDRYYIIAVSGDIPNTDRSIGADNGILDEGRLENLKQLTKLERKGDPIYLSRMTPTPDGYPSFGGTLFYFERGSSVLTDDKQVTFVTRVGPYEVRARFNLKEMQYHGKLEL